MNMKKILLTTLTVAGIFLSGFAQSLEIESLDDVVELNSTAVNDYHGNIVVKNTTENDLDVKCKRMIFGSNWCAFDSAYFCWDLCYGNETNESLGYMTINAGENSAPGGFSYFSGHVYSTTSGATCVDSIRYTFFLDKDVNDSVSVVIKYASSAVVSVEERELEISEMYPNPAATFVVVELSNKLEKGASVEMFNLLGAKVREAAVNNGRVELNVTDLHAGIYLVTINKDGKAVETRKVVVRH